MKLWSPSISLINARVVTPEGVAESVRFDERIRSIGERPAPRDVVVDCEGLFVLPGLVNAHDHLELNHYGRLKGRDRYGNASEWIADMSERLQADPVVSAGRAKPLGARLFIGGLKNLLAGTTTVAHHNPRYREIGPDFPVHVVERYGWAHSFSLETGPAGANGEPGGDVQVRHSVTPKDAPFLVHLAEGIDSDAAGEFARFDSLGCLTDNAVLVHGVAISVEQWRQMAEARAALVWCPASNAFLFRQTAPIRSFLDAGGAGEARVCLGSDSRISGSRDLLDELRAAASLEPVTAGELLRMVTTSPADALRLPQAGRIIVGAPADLVGLPGGNEHPGEALRRVRRADLELVVLGGKPMIGAPRFAAAFEARANGARAFEVDEVGRVAAPRLARAVSRCPIEEPGVRVM